MAILLKFGETASFYTFAVLLVSYATAQLGYSRTLTLAAVAAGAGAATAVIPICGALADRYGRRTLFLVGSLGMVLFAATVIAIGIVWPPITATLSSLLADAFPAALRYTGITFGYQIGAALVGGTAPLIATLLISANHGRWHWVAAYVALLSATSIAALCAFRPAGAGSGAGQQQAPRFHPIKGHS